MFLIISKYLVPKGFSSITLFPFVVVHNKKDKQNIVLINHEKIHIRQQLETLILPFFIWYGLEFLIRLMQYRNKKTAYKNISFEKEAYFYEKDREYLKNRAFWSFLKYL